MFDKRDLIHLKNLQRFLGKCKVELGAEEILAASDMLRWTASLDQRIEYFIKVKETEALAATGKETIIEPSGASVPESLPEKPKRTKKTESKTE